MESQKVGQEVIELLNQIYDNLWLGDVQEIRRIVAEFPLAPSLSHKFQRSLEDVRGVFKTAQEECRRKYGESKGLYYKSLLADEFKERIGEPSKLQEAIIGLLLLNIKNLSRQLERVEPPHEVIRKDLYKYVVLENPPKYEIRALMRARREVEIDTRRLTKRLEEKGFSVSSISEGSHAFVTAFSRENYVEVVILPPKVSITLSLLTPSKEEAQQLGEMILNSLLAS